MKETIERPKPGASDQPAQAQCFPGLLRNQVERSPEAPAIAAPGRPCLTYRRLWLQTNEAVQALRLLGVGRNDLVVIVLPDGPEIVVAFLAVAACATAVPLNPAYSLNEFVAYFSERYHAFDMSPTKSGRFWCPNC